MMAAAENISLKEAAEHPFVCPFCGSAVKKRAMTFFFWKWSLFSLGVGSCLNCRATYWPSVSSKLMVVLKYFYIPFFIVAILLLPLIVLLEGDREDASLGQASQILIWPIGIAWHVWLLYFVPKLIKKRWHQRKLKWSPAK